MNARKGPGVSLFAAGLAPASPPTTTTTQWMVTHLDPRKHAGRQYAACAVAQRATRSRLPPLPAASLAPMLYVSRELREKTLVSRRATARKYVMDSSTPLQSPRGRPRHACSRQPAAMGVPVNLGRSRWPAHDSHLFLPFSDHLTQNTE